ncbi:MAG: type II toxin-antitoxin system prevent-host-death family antitoxin [Deltaproteobacteria bacterium]|jgi:prevent-host-death family protein|nr:type II toxin-antitoxin system prevent-host-death family antitoxin [Deltaproteobacteria bacterium]
MKTGEASVGAFEAKNRFSELLDRVRHGAEVVITKHDRPVAKLVPASVPVKAERKKTTMELRALSRRYSLKGLSVRGLINEGRR